MERFCPQDAADYLLSRQKRFKKRAESAQAILDTLLTELGRYSEGMCDAEKQTNRRERRIGPNEDLITLTEAAKHLPKVDGKKVAVCTLWRWCRVGLRGMFLEYVRVGRKICTTREALLRFFSDLADLDDFIAPDTRSQPRFLKRSPITTRQRQRALAEADAILERARI